eukprot:3335898-Amphidinium_carterae.1
MITAMITVRIVVLGCFATHAGFFRGIHCEFLSLDGHMKEWIWFVQECLQMSVSAGGKRCSPSGAGSIGRAKGRVLCHLFCVCARAKHYNQNLHDVPKT